MHSFWYFHLLRFTAKILFIIGMIKSVERKIPFTAHWWNEKIEMRPVQNYVIGVLHWNELLQHVYLFIINQGYDTGRDVCARRQWVRNGNKLLYYPNIFVTLSLKALECAQTLSKCSPNEIYDPKHSGIITHTFHFGNCNANIAFEQTSIGFFNYTWLIWVECTHCRIYIT